MLQFSVDQTLKKQPLDVIYEDANIIVDPRQQEILEKYYLNKPQVEDDQLAPGMSRDNNIKFINNDYLIKHPKPTKTPPPPMWGEESEDEEGDPNEPFYLANPSQRNQFDFLDSNHFRGVHSHSVQRVEQLPDSIYDIKPSSKMNKVNVRKQNTIESSQQRKIIEDI